MADAAILVTESFHVGDAVTPPIRAFTVTDDFTVTEDIPLDPEGFVSGAVVSEIYTFSDTIYIFTSSPLTAPRPPFDADL